MSTTLRALQIIHQYKIDMPSQFGRLLWPDNPNWNHFGKCGTNGVGRGVGMRLASGGFLGRLTKKGLIRYSFANDQYVLTEKGEALLKGLVDDGT